LCPSISRRPINRFLELVAVANNNSNKNDLHRENDENTQNSERRDVGNVAPMMPVTSPTSSGQRGPHDVGNVAPSMGAVSKRSSEKSSVPAAFAAEPQNHLGTNNNKTSSAPQAAKPGAVDVEVAQKAWEAPPPIPTGKDGLFWKPRGEGKNHPVSDRQVLSNLVWANSKYIGKGF